MFFLLRRSRCCCRHSLRAERTNRRDTLSVTDSLRFRFRSRSVWERNTFGEVGEFTSCKSCARHTEGVVYDYLQCRYALFSRLAELSEFHLTEARLPWIPFSRSFGKTRDCFREELTPPLAPVAREDSPHPSFPVDIDNCSCSPWDSFTVIFFLDESSLRIERITFRYLLPPNLFSSKFYLRVPIWILELSHSLPAELRKPN